MMTPLDAARIEPFITRWQSSDGAERANYQMFFAEMTDALGVGRPYPQGQIPDDPYCFDRNLTALSISMEYSEILKVFV